MYEHRFRKQVIEDLVRDEGLKLTPYKDSVGKLTIGVGRNLDDVGLRKDEAYYLLGKDIDNVCYLLDTAIPWWRKKPDNVRCVLINMGFNLGVSGLLTFQRMLYALEVGNYEVAADEALNSKWATQVGDRAKRIADLIRGEDR